MRNLRHEVRHRTPLIGTFIKTASHQVPELLGIAGLDFAIIDAEHAPFDLETIDRMVVAARAAGLPCLVRVPGLDAIAHMLDLGAEGVVVPHVASREAAEQVLDSAKYVRRQRGFSPSTRAGAYGSVDPVAYRRAADLTSGVWCQIEDAAALSRLDEIAAVEEIDCLFIGRADLALSLGVDSQSDPQIIAAVKAIAAAGQRHGRTIGIFVSDTREIPGFLELGITLFVCGSDQSFVIAEGRRLRRDLTRALKPREKTGEPPAAAITAAPNSGSAAGRGTAVTVTAPETGLKLRGLA